MPTIGLMLGVGQLKTGSAASETTKQRYFAALEKAEGKEAADLARAKAGSKRG